MVGSDDFGRDLTGVQNLRKKHKRLEAELNSHEPSIQNVQDIGEKLMAESNLMIDEIQNKLQQMATSWDELKTMASNRGQKLDESLAYQQFVANVEEEEAWITEKQHLLSGEDLGDTLAAVQVTTKGGDGCVYAIGRLIYSVNRVGKCINRMLLQLQMGILATICIYIISRPTLTFCQFNIIIDSTYTIKYINHINFIINHCNIIQTSYFSYNTLLNAQMLFNVTHFKHNLLFLPYRASSRSTTRLRQTSRCIKTAAVR